MITLKIKEAIYLDRIVNQIRNYVVGALPGGPLDIEIKLESKNREQEKKFNAMIGDISKTVKFDGRDYPVDVWKALLVDGFEQELIANGEKLSKPGKTVISLDGRRAVTIRPTTTKFRKKEASDFIQYLYMKGDEFGATFTDKSLEYYEEMMRGRG